MPNQPNILVVFSDQQRWDTLGCYGQKLPVTPNLDRLAQKGTLFERVFTCQPLCGPARACLQTGKYATQVGCYRNGIALPPNEPTLATWLGKAGYETAYIGKWHLATNDGKEGENFERIAIPPDRRGGYKDYWLASDLLEHTSHSYDGYMFDSAGRRREFPPGQYRADVLTDWAIEYLTSRKQDRPFFLFLSYLEPHHQNDHDRFEGPRGWAERFADFDVPGDLADTQGDWPEQMADYLACCNSIDSNFGKLVDTLQKLGLADSTLLIYTSDHGCHFRTRKGEYKRSCHDSSLRIPLIIQGPGFSTGKRIGELVSLIDVPPTILSAGGLSTPETMHGKDLTQLLRGEVSDWPGEIFAQISESQLGRTIRTDRWKYCVNCPDENAMKKQFAERYVEQYLYDLHNDPHERVNLISLPGLKAERANLAQTLTRRMVQAGEPIPTIMPAEV